MRRLFSISLIASLLCSVLAPASASAHSMSGMHEACHGTKAVHHCEMMSSDEDQDSSDSASAFSNGPKCPMDCCAQAFQNSGISVTAVFALSMEAVADRAPSFASSVFTHNGFSSHTDRGPPSV